MQHADPALRRATTDPALRTPGRLEAKRIHPSLHRLLSYGAWPGLIGGSMLFVHVGFDAGLPQIVITDLVIFGTLALTLLLEKLIPYRRDWQGRAAAKRLDWLHLPLTEGTGQGLFRLMLIVAGFLLGTEITRIQAAGAWGREDSQPS